MDFSINATFVKNILASKWTSSTIEGESIQKMNYWRQNGRSPPSSALTVNVVIRVRMLAACAKEDAFSS